VEEITLHSIEKASEEAVKLWALASAQFPFKNGLIQENANATIIEVLSSFALNARRAMEVLPPKGEKGQGKRVTGEKGQACIIALLIQPNQANPHGEETTITCCWRSLSRYATE